jgi:hypothetical protein
MPIRKELPTRGVVRAAARPPESAPQRLDSRGRVGRPKQRAETYITVLFGSGLKVCRIRNDGVSDPE